VVKVRFYSIGKDFQVLETKNYESKSAAIMAATKHGIDGGYSNVRLVSDEDDYEVRVTATTPNGRAGRNIAAIEFGWEEE